jgi:hypothetical protein
MGSWFMMPKTVFGKSLRLMAWRERLRIDTYDDNAAAAAEGGAR